MKYFTPELLVRFASEDDEVADRANDEWERAIKRYRRHYKKIEPHLPEPLRKFHADHCLHDADVFGPAKLSASSLPWNVPDVVIVAQNENTVRPEDPHALLFLRYVVTEEPVVEIPLRAAYFHEAQPIWLYDEIDLVKPGVYSHEILLSNGRVVRLKFREFQLHVAPLVAPYEALNLQRAVQDKVVSA
jgi:hypothetical protein